MPKIQEYLPEVDAQGPVGGIDPNTERVGLFGRGIESFGNNLEQGFEYLNRRQEQSEQSDVTANVAQKRAEFTQQISEQTNDGTLDTAKIQNQYQDWVDKQSDSYTTPGAQNAFKRQASRLGGFLLQKASRGQAIVAGNNAKADFQNALNLNTNTLENDPSQFPDIHESMVEDLHTKIESGTVSQSLQGSFQKVIGKELSSAAVRGYIKSDYESAVSQAQGLLDKEGPEAIPKAAALEEAVGSFNTAKQLLDKGAFDDYIGSDDKKKLYQEIKQGQTAAVTEIGRLITIKKSAQAEQSENWEQQALPKLVANGLTPKDVLGSPMTAEKKYQWLNMIQAAGKEQITNPALKNSLIQRMALPDSDPKKVSDPSQLLPYVGKGISTQDYDQIKGWFDKTPSGQVLTQNRKMLLDMAKAKLVKSNGLTGEKDPDGEYNLMQYTNALQQEEQNLRAKKEPISQLYDVNSPNFFGKKLSQYQLTPQQVIQKQADLVRGQYSPPQAIQAPPALSPTPGASPSPNATPKEEMVNVIDANGKSGKIPKSNLQKAISKGYRVR